MAADYTDEPKCTQKGTGWISFEPKPKVRKLVKIKRKVRKLGSFPITTEIIIFKVSNGLKDTSWMWKVTGVLYLILIR